MKKYLTHIGNGIAGLSLLFGSAMTMQGTAFIGSVSDQELLIQGSTSNTALQQADASLQLIFGLLLILLGFFLHAYIRSRNERKVHITVKPSKKPRTERLFWMRIEM